LGDGIWGESICAIHYNMVLVIIKYRSRERLINNHTNIPVIVVFMGLCGI